MTGLNVWILLRYQTRKARYDVLFNIRPIKKNPTEKSKKNKIFISEKYCWMFCFRDCMWWSLLCLALRWMSMIIMRSRDFSCLSYQKCKGLGMPTIFSNKTNSIISFIKQVYYRTRHWSYFLPVRPYKMWRIRSFKLPRKISERYELALLRSWFEQLFAFHILTYESRIDFSPNCT